MQQVKQWAVVAMVLALGGCSNAAETFGFGRHAPDEFAVVDRAPLSLPPNYDLRPPRPGAERPQEVKMPERASQALFGQTELDSASSVSSSEQALLAITNAGQAPEDIRDKIDRESTQKVVGNRHLVDELLWWSGNRDDSTIVDAKAEAERIRKAKEEGTSVTKGATPVIEKNKSGWLGL